ncbi:hypothetical protein GS682_31560 [Nostoc sp. B(2019)]|nr:hypothetical protein [Nostoc sp. B(2019)]
MQFLVDRYNSLLPLLVAKIELVRSPPVRRRRSLPAGGYAIANCANIIEESAECHLFGMIE